MTGNDIEVPYGLSMHDVHKNAAVHARLERHCTVLERGDVLLAPSWWWHRVENLDAVNAGSSSRWIVSRSTGKWAEFGNHPTFSMLYPFDAMMLLSRLFWDPKVPDGAFFPVGESLWTDWIIQGSRLENPEWTIASVVNPEIHGTFTRDPDQGRFVSSRESEWKRDQSKRVS